MTKYGPVTLPRSPPHYLAEPKLTLGHLELAQTNAFVAEHHRHHKPVPGHRFSIDCFVQEQLVGVAIVGRPCARNIDQHNIVEVLRLCTDGRKNACSILYAACRRAAKELGYGKIITYILEAESGVSLTASGWRYEYTTRGGSWNRHYRPRNDHAPTNPKKLYSAILR